MESNAAASADIIIVPPGTYELTITGSGEDGSAEGDLDIEAPVEIRGSGQGVNPALDTIIDASLLRQQTPDRVFHITSRLAAGSVRLGGLHIRGGAAEGSDGRGGGILEETSALVILHDLTIGERDGLPPATTGNIANGKGGGIYTDGNLQMKNVTVIGNEARAGAVNPGGGGIYYEARIDSAVTVSVVATTVSGNRSLDSGGGIYARIDSDQFSSHMTMLDSTVTGNEATNLGAGIYNVGRSQFSGMELTNVTVTENRAGDSGGGIFSANDQGSIVSLRATIVGRSPVLPNLPTDCAGPSFVSLGFNLDSDNTCSLLAPTDLSNRDPQLLPLDFNGGLTFTHRLQDQSVAIDWIPEPQCIVPGTDPTVFVNRDQRTFLRPARIGQRACDIGAYEFNAEPLRINEVDSDQGSPDTAEFIELFDGGEGNHRLDGFVVVAYRGEDNLSYDLAPTSAIDLDGLVTDAQGYLTIGNAGVPGVDVVFPADTLRDGGTPSPGANAVGLYCGNASDFPTNTFVHDINLVDALVYDTDDPDDAELLDVLTPGQPQQNENASGNSQAHSLARLPNGSGQPRETTTFATATPTPGAQNLPEPGGLASLGLGAGLIAALRRIGRRG
jgi:predicted outer membrane repeat protein